MTLSDPGVTVHDPELLLVTPSDTERLYVTLE